MTTEPAKNSMLEGITKLHYKDPSENKRKSYFEISYATVINITVYIVTIENAESINYSIQIKER